MLGGIDVERLPVLVSRDRNEKLLGVPKINAETGENEAIAVYCLLQEWKLTEKVQAMSFDTIFVNTGRLTGVCKCLKDKLGRELLWLAGRQHILELICAKVFSLCFEPNNSPKILVFKRFKANWNNVDRQHLSYPPVKRQADDFKETTISFLQGNDILQDQVRDDYKELIKLTLTVLCMPSTFLFLASTKQCSLLLCTKLWIPAPQATEAPAQDL